MSPSQPTAWEQYRSAFNDLDSPFLHHYRFRDGTIQSVSLTRGQFLNLAKKAAWVLRSGGLKKGDTHLHCFSSNHYGDLVFRLAATMVGTVPVTVNWEADDPDRVVYKASLTGSKLVLHDGEFSNQSLESLRRRGFRDQYDVATLDGEKGEDPVVMERVMDEDPKITIFTSGTTGKPKGVCHAYRSYRTNKATFDQFLELKGQPFSSVIVSGLHHANATAISDWCMRSKGAQIHLLERYRTPYWKVLYDVARPADHKIIAPVVSRHVDFLAELDRTDRLPLPLEVLKQSLRKVVLLIGSAPVGPTTVKRLQNYAGQTPTVRFGSTETCLQVAGIPVAGIPVAGIPVAGIPVAGTPVAGIPLANHSKDVVLQAFQRGWAHKPQGYYIGRPHPPHTELDIVKSVESESPDFMKPAAEGESGFLITKGANTMMGYVSDPEGTAKVFENGWYTGLLDMGFFLRNRSDGQRDFYWRSRRSTLLIKGGANYAYDQISAEITDLLTKHLHPFPQEIQVAVIGLKIDSEHEDACCVTIQMDGGEDHAHAITQILQKHRHRLSKGAKPDFVRFATIPKNFKGAVQVPQLSRDFREWLKANS